jgi:hypothetical protein
VLEEIGIVAEAVAGEQAADLDEKEVTWSIRAT